MNLMIAIVLAYFVSIGAEGKGRICDSFIRDGVKPADFEKLTERAKSGRSHLAASGSGFFVTTNGYILTNHHVVDGATELVVVRDGVSYYADVVVKNKEHDLALMKINLFPRSTNGVMVINGLPSVPALEFEDDCLVGQAVFAIGYPRAELLGYEPKVTKGIVSSLRGFDGQTDRFQMDAMIDSGNSGGPVVDQYGNVVGVATAGIRDNKNMCFAVNMKTIKNFLPADVKVKRGMPGRVIRPEKLVKKVMEALVLVLHYRDGVCERIDRTTTDLDDSRRRELATAVRKARLDARMCKLKKDWKGLKDTTDFILNSAGEDDEIVEWNNLARDKLGLHLVITAEADGRDVEAQIKPICGFKESFVKCGKVTALSGGRDERGFPVEATLTFEDDQWRWEGRLKCVYDWSGTKKKHIVLKHVGKK